MVKLHEHLQATEVCLFLGLPEHLCAQTEVEQGERMSLEIAEPSSTTFPRVSSTGNRVEANATEHCFLRRPNNHQ